ncbi:MAG: DUF1571 domain-containing protein [Cytophagaceae bacterium]|nr:DUF1571 domain-containing protein [Cytophagaceae bacterium]
MERIQSVLETQKSFVKLTRNPLKIYAKQLAPKEGVEILYIKGKHNNMARVNPNGFPWVTVSLDPYGSTMRKKQHHTLLDSGYDLVVSILEHLALKYQKDLVSMVVQKPDVLWDGITCQVIEFNNPNFKKEKYTVKEGETVLTIAERNKISEYKILEENKLDSYTDVSKGQVLDITNDYASKMILYIDKSRQVPLVMKVYDDKGLYEQYEYTQVVLNPAFTEDDFSEDNDDYNF